MKLINTINQRNREFYILKDSNGYWGIESKYFNNGKLTIQVNGITGKLNMTQEQTEKAVRDSIEYEFLIANGVDMMEALMKIYAM